MQSYPQSHVCSPSLTHLDLVHELHGFNDAHCLALFHFVALLHKWCFTRSRRPAQGAQQISQQPVSQQRPSMQLSATQLGETTPHAFHVAVLYSGFQQQRPAQSWTCNDCSLILKRVGQFEHTDHHPTSWIEAIGLIRSDHHQLLCISAALAPYVLAVGKSQTAKAAHTQTLDTSWRLMN